MLNKSDLEREVGSLELLISVISSEMVQEPDYNTEAQSRSVLIKEMEEALYQLRQARGLRKMLLTALENEFEYAIAGKQAASTRNRRVALSSAC
jgi:hypothetical protein